MDALNVLLVDDEPDVCNLLKLKLTREAPYFSVRTANSADECLKYVRDRDKIDCILSDYQMPGMNGMELLDAIKEQGLDIPFIFVTGQGSEDIAREAFKNGADDYFTKDLSGFAFISRMANSIRQSVVRRKWTADILKKTAEGVPFGSGDQFFSSLVRYIATTLEVDIAFIGAIPEYDRRRVDTLCVYAHGRIVDNFSYSLANTPCETVIDNRPCIYPKNVQKLFPDDEMLVQMGLESYGGVPLYDPSGRPVGILVVVHSAPLQNDDLVRTLLLILADRAASELEKSRSNGLEAAHEGLKACLNAVGLPMAIIERGHRLHMTNDAARKRLPFNGKGATDGSNCHKAFFGLDEPCGQGQGMDCPADKVFSTGETAFATHDRSLPDGTTGEVKVVASPLYAESGDIAAVVEVFEFPDSDPDAAH